MSEYDKLLRENEELKRRLNWIAFGNDSELVLRYLRKIGYVDFDEERKVYINKHNNEPFWLDDEEEKSYYIKDDELRKYTKDLEYKNQELKNQQKEFMNYLEKKISAYAKAKPFFVEHIHGRYDLIQLELSMLKEILQNYKEIIGVLDDKTN